MLKVALYWNAVPKTFGNTDTSTNRTASNADNLGFLLVLILNQELIFVNAMQKVGFVI